MGNVYGEWLKAQRESAGLTQQELADVTIMTRSHMAHIEAGRRIPSKEDARRLDRALSTGRCCRASCHGKTARSPTTSNQHANSNSRRR